MHLALSSDAEGAQSLVMLPRSPARVVVSIPPSGKVIAALLFLVLAGCAGPPQIETTSIITQVPMQTAFAFPAPGGPAISKILARTYSNALQQDILLANAAHTSGQNLLRVQLFGTRDSGALGMRRLRDSNLSEGAIAAEMRTLLPGVRMVRSKVFVQNKYGPFGFATGRTRLGDSCFYGWQKIAASASRQTLLGNRGSVQVRIRLCDASASEASLLDVMYGFTIVASLRGQNWNPYGDAPAIDPTLGQTHHPIRPAAAVAPDLVSQPSDDGPRRRSTRTGRRTLPPAIAAPLKAPVGPTVPPPPSLADEDRPAAQPVIIPAPPQ